MKAKSRDRAIIATNIVGVLLSTYALYVEMALEAHPGYKALCDISEYASCSRVLSSAYSKGFGFTTEESPLQIPNCVYGVVFYCFMIFLTTFDHIMVVRLQLFCALVSTATSVYLAYLLAFVLHDLCIVCVSTYVVNGFLLALMYKKMINLADKNK